MTPMNQKTVSVVLGSYNRLKFLRSTIDSVRKELDQSPFSHEIIVVDGGSSDGTLKWLTKQRDVISIVQHNRGKWRGRAIERRSWGYFMNLGFKCAQGKYVCMLSDDCLVVPGAIRNGVAEFEQRVAAGEKVGAVAFYWRNWPEEDRYRVGLTLSDKMTVNHGLYLNQALQEVGYIDEEMFHFYYADGDLCMKMWHSGYLVVDCKDSYIEHYSHANLKVRSSNLEKERLDWANYLQKWDGIYYGADKSIGGELLRSYQEKECIAQRFRSADVWNCYVKGALSRAISTLTGR